MNDAPVLMPIVEFTLYATSERGERSIAFDDDLARICAGVRETGSLYEAARRAGLSYSHAWKKIGDAERQIGEPLFRRRGRLGTSLTEVGSALLEAYLEVRVVIDERARSLLQDSMSDFS